MSQKSPATIKVLPARLANQIAAGEVVERPASVLKELLENSIDAGATQIDVDIEKGGHKKIKITDNGSGIAKNQLMLALSRHATSKVSELDDLENIHTLGFRGEALASISSVSRLTLTSRTAEQSEAWQARTEGRDMQVVVEPAAHPQGTSVEVLDLFFNTPARRKFLRTEKTEFNHIEELFNRIALSRYDVGLRLKHNGKLLKNLPKIAIDDDPLKRIKQLFGASICDGLLQVEGQYQEFRLHGWLSAPGYHRAMNDVQFVFVNNRMMRDKLIFHAIRQSFEGLLPQDKFPYFVLYLDVPSHEVDVNVHPAKHEVRFHQSRLVHDFIFSVLNDALNDTMQPGGSEDIQREAMPARKARAQVEHNYQPGTDYIKPLQAATGAKAANNSGSDAHHQYRPESPRHIQEAASQYTRLMTVPIAKESEVDKRSGEVTAISATEPDTDVSNMPTEEPEPSFDSHAYHADILSNGDILLVEGQGLLLRWQQNYCFLTRRALLQQFLVTTLSAVSQPLLLPVSVKVTGVDIRSDFLSKALDAGLELQWAGKKLILKQVPAGTREQNWQRILNQLVEQQANDEKTDIYSALAPHWKVLPDKSLIEIWCNITSEQQHELMQQEGRQVDLLLWLKEQCF